MPVLTFDTRVCGIPCQVEVVSASRGYAGSYYEPPEAPEIEWILLDRKGYRAEWLERKMTPTQQAEIDQQACDAVHEYRESLSYEPD